MIAPHFAFLPDYAEGAAILARHPNLAAWLDRMEARPSMERTRWERLEEAQIAA
jgi:glutathione S-transferase